MQQSCFSQNEIFCSTTAILFLIHHDSYVLEPQFFHVYNSQLLMASNKICSTVKTLLRREWGNGSESLLKLM